MKRISSTDEVAQADKRQKVNHLDGEVDDDCDSIYSLSDTTVECFATHGEPVLLDEKDDKAKTCSSCGCEALGCQKNWTNCLECKSVYCSDCDERWVNFQ